MRVFGVVVCLLLSIVATSCGSFEKEKPQTTPKPKVICVLFDLSESTRATKVRETYLHDFKAILEKTTLGDGLVAGLITQSSVTELELPINQNFPAFQPNTNNALYKRGEEKQAKENLQRTKEKVYSVVESLLVGSHRKIMKTDILSSLQVAARAFQSYSQPRKILVIMSDMIEDSDHYNFETEKLTPRRIQAIIEEQEHKNRNRIPNLKGVKVYVLGATALNPERFNEIHDFWASYLRKCGADLEPQNYGAAFIVFDE